MIEGVDYLHPLNIWSLRHLKTNDNASRFAQAIQEGKALIVSDGSYKSGKATSAIVAVYEGDNDKITAVNSVPGSPKNLNSYRAELAGIYAALSLLELTARVHHITTGLATLGLD